jgi:membrane protease YdiL (CAAX protease family)
MVFPSVMSWVYFIGLSAGRGEPNPVALAAYAVGKAVQFSFPFVYCLLFDRGRLRPSRPTRDGLLLALGFGLLVNAAMFTLYYAGLRQTPLMEKAARQILEKLREFSIATPLGFVAFAGFVSLAHSLFEEYYFRWFIFGLLRRYLRLPAAITLSSLAFMAHHVIVLAVYFPGAVEFVAVVLPFALCVAVGGAAWAWLYERSRSLYAPWLSHLLIDVGIMAVGYDLVAPYLGG